MTTTYGASQIQKLEFLEAVRQRPGMYIGNNGLYGLHHILMEIVDNAVDECMAKFASAVHIAIAKDGTVTVSDNGRGIPVLIAPGNTESALTMALTQPHTGGKFSKGDEGAYSSSGGLHGIGAKATNAFSEMMFAEIRRHGLIFRQTFSNGGIPQGPVEIFEPGSNRKLGEITPKATLKIGSKDLAVKLRWDNADVEFTADPSIGTGTTIQFRPNREWFSPDMDWPNPGKEVPWDAEKLEMRFSQISYLYPGVKLTFLDQRAAKPETRTFYSESGLGDYLASINQGEEVLHKPIIFDVSKDVATEGQTAAARVQIAMQYAGEETEILSFVNAIPTRAGGTHEAGFKAGLTKAIKYFASQKKMLKGDDDVRGDDLLLGLTAIISITMTGTPQFQSQTKEALTSPEIQGAVLSATYEYLTTFFGKANNAQIAAIILNQAKAAARGREAASQARKLVMGKSALGGASDAVLGKLADIQRRGGEPLVPKDHTAIFLVEGDSAGGSCKQARNSQMHAILPLRGKVLNVAKRTRIDEALKNREVRAIVAAIGGGIGTDFNVDNMRYGRVVILTDADTDGLHIATLLLTFFWELMRPLIAEGRLWIAVPPLYQIRKNRGNETRYVYRASQLQDAIQKMGGNDSVTVQRYKGLGEMNPEQLRETVFRVETTQITPYSADHFLTVQADDAHATNRLIALLMGDEVAPRRQWLMQSDWNIQE